MAIKGRETVVIVRRAYIGDEDDYGNEIPTITNIVIKNCLIGWGKTNDNINLFQESIQTTATIYMPNGTVTKEDDRYILPNGLKYIKDGSTFEWVPQAGNPIKPKTIVQVKVDLG